MTACLSRSYAGNLPSSFSTLRSSALVFSTSPPVSVSGTVYAGVISWDTFIARGNPISPNNLQRPSPTHWPTNIDVVPIDYGFRPRLRGRLTLRRLALRRNPWTFGGSVSHTVDRYSCQHSLFRYLQDRSRASLRRLTERSATTRALRRASTASVDVLSPVTFSAQKPLFRPVSCYAFFK